VLAAVVGGLVVAGAAVVLAAVVGGLVVAGAAVVLAAVVGGLVVAGAAVVLAAVVGGLVVAGAAVVLAAVIGGLVTGARVTGGAAEVRADFFAEVVEERATVEVDEVATVLDGMAAPAITELVEGSAGTATGGTVPSVRVADLVWKPITAARPAIVAPTTIGARLTELAPSPQSST
jgi:hypothetical protein